MATKSMVTLSLDDLKDFLECPICVTIPIRGPIYQCESGHIICKDCHSKLTKCPQCRNPLGKTRALQLEKIIEKYLNLERSAGDNNSAKKPYNVNRKVWVQFMATGDTIGINPNKEKPNNLSSEGEIEWERSASKNVLKYKNLVETGQLIPSKIRQILEAKTNRTPQEEEILRNEKILYNKREKVQFLMVEQKIVNLDVALKMSLHHLKPDLKRCLTICDEVQKLAIVPLMLKKHPEIVATIRRMRKYVGPKECHPNPKEQEKIEVQAKQIRMEAKVIYKKFATLFNAPEDVNFGKFFNEELKRFVDGTKDMPQDKFIQMVAEK